MKKTMVNFISKPQLPCNQLKRDTVLGLAVAVDGKVMSKHLFNHTIRG